jgi:hypothetical protein
MSAPSHASRAASTGRELNADELEIVPGFAKEGIQGWVPQLITEEELRVALEKAFDYRGDVTITKKDGSTVQGYIFDRVSGLSLSESFVRLLPVDSNERMKVLYSEVAALAFTGRDTAAGKSWEAWVKKYWEKKASGEGEIGLQPESLD